MNASLGLMVWSNPAKAIRIVEHLGRYASIAGFKLASQDSEQTSSHGPHSSSSQFSLLSWLQAGSGSSAAAVGHPTLLSAASRPSVKSDFQPGSTMAALEGIVSSSIADWLFVTQSLGS